MGSNQEVGEWIAVGRNPHVLIVFLQVNILLQ